MAQSNTALKVGTVVVLAAALLAGVAYFFMGRASSGYPLDVSFRDAQGIKEEADVRLSGVRVGSVKEIEIDPSGRRAILHLRIMRDQKIPEGAQYTITSGGLLGELFVNIAPPAETKVARGEVRRDGSPPPMVVGTDLPTFDDLKVQAAQLGDGSQEILANLQTATANLAAITQDPVLRRALRTAALSAEQISRQGTQAATRLNAASAQAATAATEVSASLRQGLPALRSAMSSADRAARNVEAATRQAGPLAANANGVLLEAQNLVRGLDESNRFLRDTLSDTLETADVGPQLNQTLKNLTEASRQFKLAAEDARRITDDLATGDQGSSRLGSAVHAVQEVATKAGALLDKLTGVTDRATSHSGPLIKAVPQFDVYQQLNGDTRFRADVNVAFPGADNGALILGLRDLGEGNKLNLQYSSAAGSRMRLRYGFHAGRVGIGADYNVSGNPAAPTVFSPSGATSLSAEYYDPNHPQLDFYGRHQFNENLGLALGVEDLLHNSRPIVGLTYRP
jgi:phospholipid/cholesterol/gamma-HCH transport system substrate-binding protein